MLLCEGDQGCEEVKISKIVLLTVKQRSSVVHFHSWSKGVRLIGVELVDLESYIKSDQLALLQT